MDEINKVKRVGVLGASSFVGACLLPLLTQTGWQVIAYSRRTASQKNDDVEWRKLNTALPPAVIGNSDLDIPLWILCCANWDIVWTFRFAGEYGARRIVAVSSTSRFSKTDSSDPQEQALVRRFVEGEASLQQWAESRAVEWVILRPTLIYGLGLDKNISEIARIINRFGFFPLLGKANGLRQPIHAEDVAGACLAALQSPCAINRAYNISGGETLTYKAMVVRVFSALGRPPRLLTVPLSFFRVAVTLLRCLPRYRHWSSAMVERMNEESGFRPHRCQAEFGLKPKAI